MNTHDEQRLRATLEEQAARAIPPTTDLWPALAARAKLKPLRAARPAFAWSRVAVATLLLVAVSGAAFLLVGQQQGAIGTPPANNSYPPLGITDSITQTVGSYTLIIAPVFSGDDPHPLADGNQLALTYRVLDAAGAPVPANEPRFNEDPRLVINLTLDDGTELPWLGRVPGPPQAANEGVLVFDTTGLRVVPTAANLRLRLGFHVITYSPDGGPAISDATGGPYFYQFNLVFDPQRRIAVVGKSVTTNGITTTLDWVSVTRRATRLFYHLIQADGSPLTNIRAFGQLSDNRAWVLNFPATPYQQPTIGGWCDEQGYCRETYTGYSPVGDKAGGWSLKIDQLASTIPGAYAGPLITEGPWTIPFTMPDANAPVPALPTHPPVLAPPPTPLTTAPTVSAAATPLTTHAPEPTVPGPHTPVLSVPPPQPPPSTVPRLPLPVETGNPYAMVGEPAPDFTAQTLDGRSIRLSDYRGKQAVWLRFWTTWCSPCTEEMGDMADTYQQMGGTDLALLNIAVLQEPATVQAYLTGHPYPGTFLVDPSGIISNRYRNVGIPLHTLIDKEGVIRYRHFAKLNAAEMEQAVQHLLHP